MPDIQKENLTRQANTLTLFRKRLLEMAFWMEHHPEIKGTDPFLTIEALAGHIKEAAQKLDFALDQFEHFLNYKSPFNQEHEQCKSR